MYHHESRAMGCNHRPRLGMEHGSKESPPTCGFLCYYPRHHWKTDGRLPSQPYHQPNPAAPREKLDGRSHSRLT
ncbi:hypothetical protein LINPERHAP1_LOCUS22448 [Linum perenne]